MIGIFGNISPPQGVSSYVSQGGAQGGGFFLFLSNLFKLIGVIAGIYFVVQLILAGFQYISANGDSKKVDLAWSMIWQSILGMVIISSAFVLAGVIGRITGINILNPTIYGP